MVKVGNGNPGIRQKCINLQLAAFAEGDRKAEIYEYPCAVSKGYEGMREQEL